MSSLSGYLSGGAYLMTPQRAAVMTVLNEQTNPVSVQEIYDQAQRLGLSVGRTTVYRALALFTRLGLARKAWDEQGEARYSLYSGNLLPNCQLVCQSCGATSPLPPEKMSKLMADLRQHGLQLPPGQTLTLLWTCAECGGR